MNTTSTTNEVAALSFRRHNGKCTKCSRFLSVLAARKPGSRDGATMCTMVTDAGMEIPHCYNVVVRKKNGSQIRAQQIAFTCPCGERVTLFPVAGTLVPDHKCDARCEHATGHNCECACGGKNHGKANAA